MVRLKTRLVPQFTIDVSFDDEQQLIKDVCTYLPKKVKKTKQEHKSKTLKGEVLVTSLNRYVFTGDNGYGLVNQDYI